MVQSGISDSAIRRVLLALWANRQTTPRQLVAAAAVPESHIADALAALRGRQCRIEENPEGIALIQTGLNCWRDILEARSETGTHLVSGDLVSDVRPLSSGTKQPGASPFQFSGASRFSLLGNRTLVFQKTSSTNDICRQHARDATAHGLVVLADEQTSGRGRRGNVWFSMPGQSILMSVLLRDMPSANLNTLTLQLGLAAALAVEPFAGVEAAIKWPNDVLLSGRKVAGVLVETHSGTAADSQHVVLGIGLNVMQTAVDFPQTLSGRATSLYQVAGHAVDRLLVVQSILEKIEAICLSAAAGNPWLSAWKSRCPALGRSITAQTSGRIITGQILDIDPYYGLVLLDQVGNRHFLSAHTTTLNAD